MDLTRETPEFRQGRQCQCEFNPDKSLGSRLPGGESYGCMFRRLSVEGFYFVSEGAKYPCRALTCSPLSSAMMRMLRNLPSRAGLLDM